MWILLSLGLYGGGGGRDIQPFIDSVNIFNLSKLSSFLLYIFEEKQMNDYNVDEAPYLLMYDICFIENLHSYKLFVQAYV